VRGEDRLSGSLFSYVDLEARVPARHPLRLIREIVNDVLGSLSADFASAYSDIGRPSIAPERLIRALLLQAFYSVRSERQLMEQIEAWASMKSFRPKGGDDGGGAGRNAERDFHGEKRSNETHESTTDEDARLYRKGNGRESRLCFMGHALMENRNGLVVGGNVTIASGTAEREAALELIDRHCPGKRRRTLGADKAYDVTAFVDDLRRRKVTPHVAVQDHLSKTGKRRRPGSTAAPRYAVSQRIRKRIEEIFGWVKIPSGQAKTKFRGRRRVDASFTLSLATYNLIRLPRLLAEGMP